VPHGGWGIAADRAAGCGAAHTKGEAAPAGGQARRTETLRALLAAVEISTDGSIHEPTTIAPRVETRQRCRAARLGSAAGCL
jgi:hypothetical protein